MLWIFPIAAIFVAIGVWLVLAGGLWVVFSYLLWVESEKAVWWGLDRGVEFVLTVEFALLTIGIVASIIIFASLRKMVSLRGGGEKVALLMGGVPIGFSTASPEQRQLLNVVEEMAISSGMPVPPVYMIQSKSINAFASGWTPETAAITVTTGLMDVLSRDEMQGVIAHEFSHIVHGDIRISTRLVGVIHGIMVIGTIGKSMLYGWSAGWLHLFGAILGSLIQFVGSIGTLIGHLIQSSVSRQREYLADAAAVDYTRYPDGIAGALRKIGLRGRRNRLRAASAGEFAHFFFSAPVGGLLSTHPPLDHRIARIECVPVSTLGQLPSGSVSTPRSSSIGTMAAFAGLQNLGRTTVPLNDHAHQLIHELPQRLLESIREPIGAQAAVLGLLYDEDEALQKKQRQIVNARIGGPVTEEINKIHPYLIAMTPVLRLVILDLVVPPLARLDRPDSKQLASVISACIDVDDKIDLFEWLLGRIVVRRLRARIEMRVHREGSLRLDAVAESAARAVYAVARRGARSEEAAAEAFKIGAKRLGRDFSVPQKRSMTLEKLGEAFDQLEQADMDVRVRLLEACIAAASHDGVIRTGEYEMIRAVADAMGLPMPPIFPGAVEEPVESS